MDGFLLGYNFCFRGHIVKVFGCKRSDIDLLAILELGGVTAKGRDKVVERAMVYDETTAFGDYLFIRLDLADKYAGEIGTEVRKGLSPLFTKVG
jgi:hypothetical protein